MHRKMLERNGGLILYNSIDTAHVRFSQLIEELWGRTAVAIPGPKTHVSTLVYLGGCIASAQSAGPSVVVIYTIVRTIFFFFSPFAN